MPEYEILELLLFNAIPRIDVKPLAKRLLSTFGDLNGVVAASEHRLLQVQGATPKVHLQLRIVEAFAQRMGQAKVLKRNVVSSWDDLISYSRFPGLPIRPSRSLCRIVKTSGRSQPCRGAA